MKKCITYKKKTQRRNKVISKYCCYIMFDVGLNAYIIAILMFVYNIKKHIIKIKSLFFHGGYKKLLTV